MELSNKISAATLARTAVLLLALTNQVLSAMGKPVLPIESQTVEQLVTAGITTVAALVRVEQQQFHRRRHSGRRRIRPPEAERRVNRHPNGAKVILFKLEVLLFLPSFTAAPGGAQWPFPGLFCCPFERFTQVRGRFTQVLMIFAPKSCIIQTGTKGRNFYGNSMHLQHKRHINAHVCNKSHQTCNKPLELVPNPRDADLYRTQNFNVTGWFFLTKIPENAIT